MDINLKPNITAPKCLVSEYTHKWYQRDAKRIMKGIAWNSRKFIKTDVYQVYPIEDKHFNITYWLVELQQLLTGEVRVTPMYEVIVFPKTAKEVYNRIKRK